MKISLKNTLISNNASSAPLFTCFEATKIDLGDGIYKSNFGY